MEELKQLEELVQIDIRHQLMAQLTGRFYDLELLHKIVSSITLPDGVPDTIRGQFNVARNMALYQHFYYALAPEVKLKTYTIIEFALRLKANSTKKPMLGALVKKAVEEGWISDAGFRHIQNPQSHNPYCMTLTKVLPNSRNELAHGTNQLMPGCIGHLERCADLVNQLFTKVAIERPAT